MQKKLDQPAKRPTQPSPNPLEIKQTRRSLGLTQAQAASIISVALITWQNYEQGNRKIHPAFWELFTLKTSRNLQKNG